MYSGDPPIVLRAPRRNAHNSETRLTLFSSLFPSTFPLAALNFEPSATMHTPRQCRPTIRLRLRLRQMRF